MSLNQLQWIDLPRFADARGVLTSLEVVPFDVRNVFFLHSVRSERGGHAHRKTHQLIVPVSGSFTVRASDGSDSIDYQLLAPARALHVPPMHWLRLYDFTPSAVCLVLTDRAHDDADYIRDWDEFVALSRSERARL
jgi:dTDP-4-dehydrorhamnose 3,5-epimerase-like enzyme